MTYRSCPSPTFPIFAALFWIFVAALGHAESTKSANRAWLPGAMVEVEILDHVTRIDEDNRERLADVRVEVKEVFTGPDSLKGEQIQINPTLAFRFPPERWCAYGMSGIFGDRIEGYPTGRRGLIWLFQRRELVTGSGHGKEFHFFTGFLPVWERSADPADANAQYYLREWKDTRSMMGILKNLEPLDEAGKEQAVLKLLEHENPKARAWAFAALARVKGVGMIPLLEPLRKSEAASSRIADLFQTTHGGNPWEKSAVEKKPIVAIAPLLGVEVLTAEKRSARRGLGSPKQPDELGSVKVLRVFSGSGFEVGAILPAQTGGHEPGVKYLVSPKDGNIILESWDWNSIWSFPPQGLWDGANKRLGYRGSPGLNLDAILPWLEKITNDPAPDAGGFIDDAMRNAPLLVAYWAFRTHHSQLKPETLEWLESRLEIDPREVSLQQCFLYDFVMRYTFNQLWNWDMQKERIMEQILSHPLTNEEEAWLLYEIIIRFWDSSQSGGSDRWARLAKAVRDNKSWKEDWINPIYRQQFERTAWFYTMVESRAKFDATPAIDYLVKRWAIPDHDKPGTDPFVNIRGSTLAHYLPLKPEEINTLRASLAARLSAADEAFPPETTENMIQSIRAMTWEEILDQRFP